ncbi:MAG: hypothetical protein ACK49N_04330, partial [Verrucomicrobiota bacterium]
MDAKNLPLVKASHFPAASLANGSYNDHFPKNDFLVTYEKLCASMSKTTVTSSGSEVLASTA